MINASTIRLFTNVDAVGEGVNVKAGLKTGGNTRDAVYMSDFADKLKEEMQLTSVEKM